MLTNDTRVALKRKFCFVNESYFENKFLFHKIIFFVHKRKFCFQKENFVLKKKICFEKESFVLKMKVLF